MVPYRCPLPPSAPPVSDEREMWSLLQASDIEAALQASLELGLFDALVTAPLMPSELASRIGVDHRALRVVLEFLGALSLVERQRGRIALTSCAALLFTKRSPASCRSALQRGAAGGVCERGLAVVPFELMPKVETVLMARDRGVFETLARCPLTLDALGSKLGLTAAQAQSLCAELVELGLLEWSQDTVFSSHLALEFLLQSSPFDWEPALRHVAAPGAPAELVRACRTGKPPPRGDSDIRHADEEPEQARSLALGAHARAAATAARIARDPVFRHVKRLVDVGGGLGTYAVAAALANPKIRATVIDFPSVCLSTTEYVAAAGLAERVDVVATDIFDDWPGGPCDAVLMSDILHDCRPVKQAELLRHAYERLEHGGHVLVHEVLQTSGSIMSTAFSVAMLRATEGEQLRFDDLTRLLATAGFSEVQIVCRRGAHTLVRARKPPKSLRALVSPLFAF
jgi:precorrin-6B methylase 2